MTRRMVIAIVVALVALLALLGNARADDDDADGEDDVPISVAHARRSATLYLGSWWSPAPTVPIRIGAEATVRFNLQRVALEVRGGFGGAGSITGFSTLFGWHIGGSIGGVLTAGSRVEISPMLAYDVFGLWDADGTSLAIHYVTLELPIGVVLARGVVLEAFAQLGMARDQGMTDPAIVVGPRIGIVL